MPKNMSDKHVALISNTDGAQFKFRGELIKRLRSEGYKVTSISSIDSPEGCYYDDLISIANSVFSYPFLRKGIWGYIKTIVMLYRNLAANNYSIVHVFGHEAAVPVLIINYFLLKKPKLFITFTGFGRLFSDDASVWKKILAYLIVLNYKIFASSVKNYICLNGDDLEYVRRNISNSRKAVATRGEGLKFVANTNADADIVFDSSFVNILYAGRLMASKGILELLSAMRLLESHNIKLIIAGSIDPALKNDPLILDLINGRIPMVEYINFVSNIHDYISASDVVILPTKYKEGMPMILVEALASDKFIISSRAPGVNDMFADGCFGVQLDKVTDIEIANVLDRIDFNHVRNVGGANAAIYAKSYSDAVVNKHIIELYTSHDLRV